MKKPAKLKYSKLKKILKSMRSAVVAFSGGVDSTLLLKTAKDVLGKENVAGVIACSETYTKSELYDAKRYAKKIGILPIVITTKEILDRNFTKNPPNRCYFCKKELFTQLEKIRKDKGFNCVADGSNVDDKSDFRPGFIAKKELHVNSPLAEAGLTKQEIREISKSLRLPSWNKPSIACLASRFPYYEKITVEKLNRVQEAENIVRKFGVGQLRVRFHKDIARIEVMKEDFRKLMANSETIVDGFKKLGFNYVALDLQGYRTGSMNEPLKR